LGFFVLLTSCDGGNSSDTSSSSSGNSASSSGPDIEYQDYYSDYYDSIESWTDGDNLREQLRTLVNYNVNLVDFNASSNIWAVNQLADETIDNYDRIDIVYGNYQPLKTFTASGSNGGWQREHAFAQSLGDFDVASASRNANESLIMRSDFHNLFASDGTLNGSRNNLNLGDVTSEMGAISNPKDSFGNETECYRTDFVFEPPDKDKPMLSRAIFYIATRFADLDVVEGISAVRSKTHGMLSDLLEWSESPVTRREYKHNIGVYHFQNNRNPYIDYPELVDYVFGDKKDEAGVLKTLRPSYYDVVLAGGEENAGDTHNLTIRNVKSNYMVGDPFSKADDLKVFTVANDLTLSDNLGITAFETTYADFYHFVDGDLGKKTVSVSHQSFNVSYEIEIISSASSLALYKYILTADDAFKDKTAQSTPYSITLGGLAFDFYMKSGYASQFQASAGTGRQFGTKDYPIDNMYLETSSPFNVDDKTRVNAVYIVASTNKNPGASPAINVSIGEYSFPQRALIIGPSGTNTLYSFEVPEEGSYEGKVRIAFSGFTDGALYIKQFAINAV
jgi:endonuclease I